MSATPPKVTLISPPWYPVPPVGYGGIELVVYLLARELRRRGLQVEVLSVSESGLQEAVGLAPGNYSSHLDGRDERWYDLAYASRVLRWLTADSQPRIIHDHTRGVVLAALASGPLRLPVLHTVHGAVGAGEAEFYRQVQSGSGLVAISHAQARTAPDLKWAGVVENAVDVDHLFPGTAKDRDDYLLVLARISPEKGQHLAIEVAARVGLPLVLAGKVDDATHIGRRYYLERIKPHLDGQKVTHIPNISGWEKARLLSRALALLAPSQWEEPFGLAMAESLASGTPVVAFPRGAAVDLIQDGINGLLCPDLDSMVARLESVRDLVPERIAASARERFSPARMADGYQSLYRSALAGTALSLWSEMVPPGWPLDHFQLYSAETDLGPRFPVPSPAGSNGDPTRS